MDNINCPECSNRATRMPVLSYVSRSDNYYHCGACGQVSQMPKDASTGAVVLKVAAAFRAQPVQ
jgi:uncharacterized Zn finger protein